MQDPSWEGKMERGRRREREMDGWKPYTYSAVGHTHTHTLVHTHKVVCV